MDKMYGLEYILNIIILPLNNHDSDLVDFGKHTLSFVYIFLSSVFIILYTSKSEYEHL